MSTVGSSNNVQESPHDLEQPQQSQEDETRSVKSTAHRSHVTRLLCGVYALLIIVLGIVISVCKALKEDDQLIGHYLEIFSLYLYCMSFIFLLYLHCYLLRQKTEGDIYSLRRSTRSVHDRAQSPDSCGNVRFSREIKDTHASSTWEHRNSTTSCDPPKFLPKDSIPPVMFDAGVNFYLRLGAIAFGVGYMIFDGFLLADVIHIWSFKCMHLISVITTSARVVFAFFQTYFIFKSHSVVINKHKVWVRFGLMHMLATNMVTWVQLLISETAEDVTGLNKRHYMGNEDIVTPTTVDVTSPGVDVTTGLSSEYACMRRTPFMKSASSYLYPCVIEYSLIAAAILYEIYYNVGKFDSDIEEREDTTLGRPDFDKANKGLFLGLLVVILSLISLSLFFVLFERPNRDSTSFILFYMTEIGILFLSLACSILGICRLQQLKFAMLEEQKTDSILLLIAYFLFNLFNGFMAISSIANINKFGFLAILPLITSGLSLIQTTIQSVFIIDGLQRCAGTDKQVESKPGRTLITFLLLCNLSLWIIHTFEEKKSNTFPMHAAFYGEIPWAFIVHSCIPLIIFYRFHSTVCLSAIWVFAYTKRKLR